MDAIRSMFPHQRNSIRLYNHNVHLVTLSLDQDILYFLCLYSLCRWNLESKKYKKLVDLPSQLETSRTAVLDNSSLMLAAHDGGLYCLDFDGDKANFHGNITLLPVEYVNSFNISPDGRFAIVETYQQGTSQGGIGRNLRLWKLQPLEFLCVLLGHERSVYGAARFTPDGSQVITTGQTSNDHGHFRSEQNRYRIWSTADGSCLSSFGGPRHWRFGEPMNREPWDRLTSHCMDISQDGRFGLFETVNGLAVVELLTWNIVQEYATGAVWIRDARFSANETRIFALGKNQVFYVWNRASGEIERLFGGYCDYSDNFIVTADDESYITTHGNGGYGAWIYRHPLFREEL